MLEHKKMGTNFYCKITSIQDRSTTSVIGFEKSQYKTSFRTFVLTCITSFQTLRERRGLKQTMIIERLLHVFPFYPPTSSTSFTDFSVCL